MKIISSVRYWIIAILFCSTSLLSACKKEKDEPEVIPQEDEITTLVRAYAAQRSAIPQIKDPKLVPVTVSYGDYTYKDADGKNVTITGKGRFTEEKARALASLIPVLVSLNENTSPVTVQFWHEYEKIRGGFYSIGLLMSSSPPPSGNDNYALVDVSEVVVEPEGSLTYLTKFAFVVSKK